MKTGLAAIACAWVFSASMAQGADYFIYQDPAGKIVLSNMTPPPAAEVIKHYDLQDVTAEAVRAALEREHSFWLRLKDEQLAESNRKLVESNSRLAEAITTAAALREWEPDVLVQVAGSDRSRFARLHRDRLRQRDHLHSGFRRHSRLR
jgi:hypothetical protein